ncbi:AAA family ATPase [bacterium]|nr:AAA family ATPase [bacterium]
MAELGSQRQIIFHPFRLDSINQCLYRGQHEIPLRPKTLAVLEYLLKRPGQLVTKTELLNAVWPDTFVTDAVLKVSIREIRDALGDDQKKPGFIETAHRRGYRFIAKIALSGKTEPDSSTAKTPIGRDAEMLFLHRQLEKALSGKRQVVFITGESGIGKTTLVEAFLSQVSETGSIAIARGQCLEQYGASEPYMPVMEAISELCQTGPQEMLVSILRKHAPMCLIQMPELIDNDERTALQQETIGATRERMLREMSQAFGIITQTLPLILFLEDLHWSDYSTVDLLSCIARHKETARLLIIGTYRPTDVIAGDHPLKAVKQELQTHRLCEELPLHFLSERSIADYLNQRFPVNSLPLDLTSVLHKRTDGHPIFFVNLIEYLVDHEKIIESDGVWKINEKLHPSHLGTPDNIGEMIEKQIDELSDEEQNALEAGSVAGMKFSAHLLAAALSKDVVHIEKLCGRLAKRHQFLKTSTPSENSGATFEFMHVLHQEAIYDRILPAYCRQLHLRIGEYKETFYGPDANEIAGELTVHFDRAKDFPRAVKYLNQAAENAKRRLAYREAAELARKGLQLLQNLPDSSELARQEISLQMTLCAAISSTEGYGAPVLESSYLRALQLCDKLDDAFERFRVLRGLRSFYLFRADLQKNRDICEQLVSLAENRKDAALLTQAYSNAAVALVHLGEFEETLKSCEKALSFYEPSQMKFHLAQSKFVPAAIARCCASWSQWFLGYPDRSLNQIHLAFQLAEEINHLENWCYVFFYATFLHKLRRNAQKTLEGSDSLIKLAHDYELGAWDSIGLGFRGWALVELGQRNEGIALLRKILAHYQQTGSEIARLHFSAALAESLLKSGQTDEASTLIDEILKTFSRHGSYFHEAELYRLKGELLNSRRQKGAQDQFLRAIEVAKRQKAKSLELRAVLSLYRQQGNIEARQLLQNCYNWFSEGFDTADLKDISAILQKKMSSR